MDCNLTEAQISQIVFGITRRVRVRRADLWRSRGVHRKGMRSRLTKFWVAEFARDPYIRPIACAAWADYQESRKLHPAASKENQGGIQAGAGTELKKLLGKIGIIAAPGCSCNSRAALMDKNGPDWCQEHLEEIIGWLGEESAKRHLPFIPAAARLLVKRAIGNARKLSASTGAF